MTTQPQAKIVSYHVHGAEACASAARISTTQGNAGELFEQARGNPGNRGLIEKVLASGHKSVVEHAVFTIAFWNVSVCVEQYLIECRLASFTVKSRRYVDFRGAGYYVPPELAGEDLTAYRQYMDPLFAAYGALLEAGAPREDARFLLPYAFHSSFYCTVNARELAHILRSIRWGRGRGDQELRALADQLTAQLEELFPCLLPEIGAGPSEEAAAGPGGEAFRMEEAPVLVEAAQAGAVRLLSAPEDPLGTLEAAWRLGGGRGDLDLAGLVRSDRPRELEQLCYSFLLSDVSLAGVTHVVRHRMQSVLVPPVGSVNHSRYILPDTVRDNPAALEIYRAALASAHRQLEALSRRPALGRYSRYFALSGNLVDLMTTLNARELEHLIRLRTCRRAQWEIRAMAVSMLAQLRAHCPALYSLYGPGCYLAGRCPEGRMSCGGAEEVRREFAADRL